jgi:hypothetical protein
MALFDTNSGLGGLLGNLGDYGFGLPTNTGGLVADPDREAINKRALLSGLISAGLTYAATPKNLNTGSALPYLGKAGLAGFNTSQDVVDRALNSAYRNKLLAGRDDGFSNINPLDVTPESLKLYIEGGKKDPSVLRKAIAEDKSKYTDTYGNIALSKFGTDNPSKLTLEQRMEVDAEARKRSLERPPSTVVQNAFESSYNKELGGKTAERQLNEYDSAYKASNNISKIDQTLNQIKNTDAITGFGADVQKNVERFKAKVLADKAAGKKVADTEILDSFLGSDVFPQINALGIGAKGLDTPAEREFLRQVMTGTISMNKDALIKMTEIRRNIEQRAIDRYNKNVDSGQLDNFFKTTGYKKEKFTIPDNSGFRIVE